MIPDLRGPVLSASVPRKRSSILVNMDTIRTSRPFPDVIWPAESFRLATSPSRHAAHSRAEPRAMSR